ncbi:hypothetical protein N7456_010729 [Penicillium angulare]|uniref:Major facilitator superfamily domain, general substrate transporter n=1 Tax=Penicillium angulare TaxID=116970 RepID=A0A9W9F777_9EURO|nr:hypothetical protein N7456_010729 [Penicillium angulare]
MAVRAFQGTHYLLGSWYTEEELGKRSGLFTSSGIAGGMFAGSYKPLFTARWMAFKALRVGVGCLFLPVAIYRFLYFPNTPTTTTASYLSTEERELAVSRIPIVERTPILSKRFFKKAAISYYMWSFTVLWCIANCLEAPSSQSLMNLYMKALPGKNYTVSQLNNYPTGVQAVGIVLTLYGHVGLISMVTGGFLGITTASLGFV